MTSPVFRHDIGMPRREHHGVLLVQSRTLLLPLLFDVSLAGYPQQPAGASARPDRSRNLAHCLCHGPHHSRNGNWPAWPGPAGRSRRPSRPPKAELVWTNTRSAATTAGIDTSPWHAAHPFSTITAERRRKKGVCRTVEERIPLTVARSQTSTRPTHLDLNLELRR
jgi:hypothetical protein